MVVLEIGIWFSLVLELIWGCDFRVCFFGRVVAMYCWFLLECCRMEVGHLYILCKNFEKICFLWLSIYFAESLPLMLLPER